MKRKITHLTLLMATLLCCIISFSQQQIGYYPNMDGGLQKQSSGNVGQVRGPLNWSFVSVAGGGQTRNVTTTGGYGGGRYITIGKSSAATSGNSTTVNTNEVTTTTFSPNTLYVMQFTYRANTLNAATPDPASFVFISADGSSGTRKSKTITLATPTTWTKFYDTVRTDNLTPQATTGTAGINIRTAVPGTAVLVDIDNYVIYPADNQTTGAADITAPDPVTAINTIASPADVSLDWSAPTTGIDNGGYVVVRYTTNPTGTDNPLQNAIFAVGDSVINTNTGTVVYVGKNPNALDNLNILTGTTYYYKVYTADKAFNYSTAASATATTLASYSYFYYNGTGSLTSLSSWGTNINGTGTAPTNFTNAAQIFTIANTTTASLDAPWIVSGSASKVVLGDAAIPGITLTILPTGSLTGSLDITAASSNKNTLVVNGGAMPALKLVNGFPDITIGTSTNTSLPKRFYGNVVINSPATTVINMSDTLFVNNLTINAGSVFSTTTNASSNNTIAPVTIASGGAVNINGTFKTGKTAGFVASLNFLSGTPNYTLGSNSTIVFDKVSTGTAQNINALQYVNLTIAGASPKSFDVGLIKVSGNFKYTNTGAINVAPSTFELNGTSTQSFDGIPAPFFGNTIFSGGGKKILSSDATIAGAISLTAGTVDVDVYKLNLLQSATIGAGSNSSYFVTGNNALGRVLVSSAAATAITVPVGSPNNYLPVKLLPDSVSSYSIAAFDGLTVDGTYGAALVDAATKSESVDAFWDISRIVGTGNVKFETSWPSAIEGANFNAASNSEIGLLHNTGVWVSGTNAIADNALNSASATFSSFSPFAVSKIGGLLPVSKIDLQLAKQNNDVNIIWKTVGEKNTKSFVIEKSTNGVEFTAINTVDAKGNTINENVYSIVDRNVNATVVYYRIKIIDVNGKSSYSNVATIKMNGKHSFEIVANPIINKELKVQINNLPKGNYTIEILNSLGQKKQQINLTSNSTSVSQTILLNNTISNGLYFVRLSGIDFNETNTVIVK